jgi:hypothetical protein
MSSTFRGLVFAIALFGSLGSIGCARETPPPAPYWFVPAAYSPAYSPAPGQPWQVQAQAPPATPAMPAAAYAAHAAPPAPGEVAPVQTPPAWFPESQTYPGLSLPSGAACAGWLAARGIRYEPLADRRGIETPVAASSPVGGVRWTITPAGPLVADCRLVLALAQVGPELAALGISEVRYSSAYSYRFTRTGRLSLHARGLAIDVHEVKTPDGSARVLSDFARGVGDGCAPQLPLLNRAVCRLRAAGLFREVITPDHDADHQDHVHLGVASARR